MHYGFLSGGTGTPKLLQGFRSIIEDKHLGIICNTGDDYDWYNLRVSPDLDTILYLFSNKLDEEKFWGVNDETFLSVETMKSLGENVWFNVGDRDLGLHVFRTQFLKNGSLTEFTKQVCYSWKISATIRPMCNQQITSYIYTNRGKMHFQEYFVKNRWEPTVTKVKFVGEKEKVPPETLQIIEQSKLLIIGPSNPVTSIGPILSVTPLRKLLKDNKNKVVAISPLLNSRPFSGPTAILMESMGIDVSSIGLVQHYKEIISAIILDPSEKSTENEIRDLGIEPIFHSIELKEQSQKIDLANFITDHF